MGGPRARAALLIAALAPVEAAGSDYGAHLAAECSACHRAGETDGEIPAISGWPVEAFAAAMRDYRSGARTHAIMNTVAGRLTDGDIAALAVHYRDLEGKSEP